MLRLITPVKHEQFGFIDYKAANTLGPLFGDGFHGTGVTQGGNGKLFAEACVERRGETNVSLQFFRGRLQEASADHAMLSLASLTS